MDCSIHPFEIVTSKFLWRVHGNDEVGGGAGGQNIRRFEVRKALAAQLHRKVAPDLILAQNLRNHP